MDLRMVKTHGRIRDAFLNLRKRLMPDKIKVKDICEMAMINKTTFYHHYADSWQLSNEIDDSAIDQVLSNFSERGLLFEDPKRYLTGLIGALERESEHLRVVFRGKQEILCAKLEARLRAFYDKTAQSEEDRVTLSFAVGGFVRVAKDCLFAEKSCDTDRMVQSAVNTLETLLNANADTSDKSREKHRGDCYGNENS